MMQKQQGFTLIELVVVIVILGLLAATALPRFINATNKARAASVQGVAGGLRSAISLARSQFVLNGDKTAVSITMDGQTVAVLAEGSPANGHGGRPTAASGGIETAMPNPDGFTVDDTTTAGSVVYTPTGIPTTNTQCRATYTPANDPPVVVDVSNC